jgi:hypothetical protein
MKYHTQHSTINQWFNRSNGAKSKKKVKLHWIRYFTIQTNQRCVLVWLELFWQVHDFSNESWQSIGRASFEIPVGWSSFCMGKDAKAGVIWSGIWQDGVQKTWLVSAWLVVEWTKTCTTLQSTSRTLVFGFYAPVWMGINSTKVAAACIRRQRAAEENGQSERG